MRMHDRIRLSAACAAIVIAALVATPCAAQESSARLERARAAFETGMLAFEQGDMVGAREGFERAYELTESPSIRFNLGLVEERVGHFELAAAHYRAYLASGVPADEEATVRARLSAVEARVQAAPSESSPSEGTPSEGTPTQSTPTQSTTPAPLEAHPERAAARPGPDFTAGALTMGVGLAVSAAFFGLAGGYWASANDHYASFSGCAPSCSPDEVAASGAMTEVDLTNGFMVAGAVAALATLGISIALFAIAGEDGAEARVLLGPGQLSVRGRW